MGKLSINFMTVVAIFCLIFGVISLGCYEGEMSSTGAQARVPYLDFFEAAVIIGWIVALIIIVITCLSKPEPLVGRTYLFFGLCGLLLLIGLILIVVHHGKHGAEITDRLIAAYVFAGFELLACLVGVTAPFALAA